MNRALLKRLCWLALPVVLLVGLTVYTRTSPAFEGRRWLRERSRAAIRMDIGQNQTYPKPGETLRYVSTTNRAEIQHMLGLLNCVGSLNNGQQKPRFENYGWIMGFYSIRLQYGDGGVDILTLCDLGTLATPSSKHDLIHDYSSSGEGVAHSTAKVSPKDFLSFLEAHAALEKRKRVQHLPFIER